NGIVDLVLIDLHEPTLPRAAPKIPRSCSDGYVPARLCAPRLRGLWASASSPPSSLRERSRPHYVS
ncbi:hypothetical protein E0H68_29235, partial [Rhizobium leguminosarum bv. viciae]